MNGLKTREARVFRSGLTINDFTENMNYVKYVRGERVSPRKKKGTVLYGSGLKMADTDGKAVVKK